MTVYGKYIVVDVISLTSHGSVSTARLRDGEPEARFAIKLFKAPTADPDEPQWESQSFLDRARVQRSVLASGGRFWAPVHDMGITPEGAWIATDYHPLTVQKLIDAKVKLRHAALHCIVHSIVKGLVELHEVRHRAHGSLKPSNVLIEAHGDLSEARVLLTDPAQGVSEGEPGDMYALGQLIHQLVLHRPHVSGDVWRLAASSEWARLGRAGAKWRQLCGDLLNDSPQARPRLRDVAKALRAMAPAKKAPVRRILAGSLAACLLLGAGATFAVHSKTARAQLAREKSTWVKPLALALADPQRRARYNTDPALRDAVEELFRGGAAQTPCENQSWLAAVNVSEFQHVRSASASLARVRADLSPEHWQRLAAVKAMRQLCADHGWRQPVQYLDQLIARTQPGAHADVAGGIDHLLDVQPAVERGVESAAQAWAQLEERVARLDATNDPVLHGFAISLRRAAAFDLTLSDNGINNLEAVRQTTALASRLNDASRQGWPAAYDTARLAQDTRIDPAHAQVAQIDKWLGALPLYSVRRTETAAAANRLRQRLLQATDAIRASKPDPTEAVALAREQEQVDQRIAKFQQTAFIEKELEDGTFSSRRTDVEARIDGLRKYAHPESPADWVNSLPAIATTSEWINAYWDRWKSAQLDNLRRLGGDRTILATLKARAEALRRVLGDLDRTLPAAPASGMDPKFLAAARDHRERELGKLLDALDGTAPRLDVIAAAGAASRYSEWCTSLRDLAKDFPIRKQLLASTDRPDEKWAAQEDLWKDPAVQEALKPDLDRLGRLRAVATMPRDQLVQLASSSDDAEVALAAYRSIASDGQAPAWPATIEELSTERRLRQRMVDLLQRVTDPSERSAPLAMLHEQGPRRWQAFVEHARSEAMLQAAADAREAMGAGPEQVAQLSPRARYDLWLLDVRREAAANDNEALAQSLDEGRKIFAAAKQPALAARVEQLAAAPAKEPFAEQNPKDVFRVALANVQPPVEFKRVDPADGSRPFYLSTTEVSLHQFAGVVQALSRWDDARRLPWGYLPGGTDTRRGPRVWEWVNGFGMDAPQVWLAPDEVNDFPPELRAQRFQRALLAEQVGGNPSDSHPMQQISAEAALWYAALCGCRLPTAREWQTAYNQYEKSISAEQWNLRDRTWEVQRRYVAANLATGQPAQWPDEGAFRPDGDTTTSAHGTTSRPGSDGILFFRPVAASGGAVFHHLVGNVAEYVCDDPTGFDGLAEKRPDSVRKFVEHNPHVLHVIGGSALSPPEVPVDQPLPLARPDRGYADVGFRLAFTAPARTVAERVKWALAGQSYLWPGQEK